MAHHRGMAHHFGKSPRASRLTVPPAANPLCQMVFAEARRQGVSLEDLSYRAGVQRGTVKLWRRGIAPRYFTVESTLGALGWDISAQPSVSAIPSALRRDLESALQRLGHKIPALELLPSVAAMAPQ